MLVYQRVILIFSTRLAIRRVHPIFRHAHIQAWLCHLCQCGNDNLSICRSTDRAGHAVAQRWFTQINAFWSYIFLNHWETIGKPSGNHWETIGKPILTWYEELDCDIIACEHLKKHRVLASLEDHLRKRWYLSPQGDIWWSFFFVKKKCGLSHGFPTYLRGISVPGPYIGDAKFTLRLPSISAGAWKTHLGIVNQC